MPVDLSVANQDLLELRSRGDLLRDVFFATFRVRLRALLADGADRNEAERESAEEAYAVVLSAFPGWDCTYRFVAADPSPAVAQHTTFLDP